MVKVTILDENQTGILSEYDDLYRAVAEALILATDHSEVHCKATLAAIQKTIELYRDWR